MTLLSVASLLGGCGVGTTSTYLLHVAPVPSALQISGSLHGGQMPITGANVKVTVSSRVPQSSTAFTAGGVSGPIGIAVDSGKNVWASNFTGGSVTELNSSGAVVARNLFVAGLYNR